MMRKKEPKSILPLWCKLVVVAIVLIGVFMCWNSMLLLIYIAMVEGDIFKMLTIAPGLFLGILFLSLCLMQLKQIVQQFYLGKFDT